MKKFLAAIMASALVFSFSGLTMAADESKPTETPASSDANEIKWIADCMDENMNKGQSAEVLRKYCECMISKMYDNESESITHWEKSHPQEQKECSYKAGWK